MSEKTVERLDADLGVFYTTRICEAPADLPDYRRHSQYAKIAVRGVEIAEVWAYSPRNWCARFLKGDRKVMRAARMEAAISQAFTRRVRSVADPKDMTIAERTDALLPSVPEQKRKLKRDLAKATSRSFAAELHQNWDVVIAYIDAVDGVDAQKHRQASARAKAAKFGRSSDLG